MTKRQLTIAKACLLNGGIMALLCLWIISINRTSSLFVNDVLVHLDAVEGERDLISAKNIKTLITKELPNDVMHQRVVDVDISTIESMLRADTRILSAEVFVDAHQNLVVEAVQRRPILRVMNQHNDQYYIDQSGAYVRKVDKKATRVPVVTGYVEPLKPSGDITKLPRLTKAYKIIMLTRKDPVLKALIEQVHFEKEGRIVLIPKIGDDKIVIDHLDQLEKKLENLKLFYKQLAMTDSWEKYDEINISYHNQVVPRNSDNP